MARQVTITGMEDDDSNDVVAPSAKRPRHGMASVKRVVDVPELINVSSVKIPPETPLIQAKDSLLCKFFKAKEKPSVPHVYVERCMLTPELANWMDDILRHPMQRSLSKDRVARMKRVVEDKQWHFLGDSIVIAKSGFVVNGQHRAAGISAGGYPVETLITFGIDDKLIQWMDHNRSRQFGDALKMEGYPAPKRVAAAVTVLQWLDADPVDFNLRGEPHELKAVKDKHDKGLRWAAEHVPTKIDNPNTRAARREVTAGFAYVYPIARDKVAGLLGKYVSGESMTKTHPMMQLRGLVGPEGFLAQSGETDEDKICRVLRCLEAGLKDLPLTSIRVDTEVIKRVKALRKQAKVES